MSPKGLVEHFFRHEYGRLVAGLSRRLGVQHIDAIEDAAQSALLSALSNWQSGGLPDDPAAWLYVAARNHLTEALRRESRRAGLLSREQLDEPLSLPEAHLPGEVADDLLRMLFICCDNRMPHESQLILALKTLCGFDVREIAARLFCSEATVYKRLERARTQLRKHPSLPLELSHAAYQQRLGGVHSILYLLFTEGYLSSHPEFALRWDLCSEALRLVELLAEHAVGQTPETFALCALMQFHAARMDSRQDGSGGLLLLEEQDRSRWDQQRIAAGMRWLERSATGDSFSRYHAEAAIAAEHCLAASFEATPWDRLVAHYELLEQCSSSPLHRLNRAVALAQWQGPAAALALLAELAPPSWLRGSYMWSAVLADLHGRSGHTREAQRYRALAIASAPNVAVQAALQRRLRWD